MHCGSPVLPVNYVSHGLLTGKIFTKLIYIYSTYIYTYLQIVICTNIQTILFVCTDISMYRYNYIIYIIYIYNVQKYI